jgi:DNA-binding transcriptional regulator GbsR (MarR family)
MKTNFSRQNIPFTMVANAVLSDPNLSLQAKGLYAYLYSKPENWNFSVFRIIKETKNGRDGTLAAIQELEQFKLLRRVKQPTGRTTYWVTYPPDNFSIEPDTENPELANKKPSTENPHVRKIRTMSKKELVPLELKKEGENTLAFLESLPKEKAEELHKLFKCSTKQITIKARELADYCKAKGKTYADYYALLSNTLRKDYGEREVLTTIPACLLNKSLTNVEMGRPMDNQIVDPETEKELKRKRQEINNQLRIKK